MRRVVNSTLIQGDLVEEVAKIKEEPGEDILMYGFGPVGESLLQNGLLDVLRLFDSGVVVLSYAPAGKD